MKTPLSVSPPAALSLALLLAFGSLACKNGRSSSASDAGARDGAAAAAVASGLPPPPDVAAPPADATTTASGLASKVLVAGTGTDHPGQNDTVKVNYTGWTTDGKMFDSSVAPLQPGRKGRAHHVVARARHPGVDRGTAADGRRREATLLDPRGARVQGQAGRARRACSSSTSSCSTSRRARSRPRTSPPRPPTRRRPRTAWRARSRRRARARTHPQAERRRARELFDLAARRKAPRRLEGQAGAAPGDRPLRRLDRGCAANGRRREAHALGARRPGADGAPGRDAERRHDGRRAARHPSRARRRRPT